MLSSWVGVGVEVGVGVGVGVGVKMWYVIVDAADLVASAWN